jgi:glycosyltransferase involved in cell wall biosynthesis
VSHRVLVITYLFPPSGGIGPPRYVGYTRHLPTHGCQVSVLTAKTPNTPLYDPGLGNKVPPETKIHRVFNPDVPYAFRDRIWKRIAAGCGDNVALGIRAEDVGGTAWGRITAAGKRLVKGAIERVFNPDVQRFWVPFVLRRARKIIVEEGIETVILNTPPFSLHAIIPPLKREFPNLRWITEVRDDWIGYYLENFDSAANAAKRKRAVEWEGAGMRASDYVVAVTPANRDAMRARYPDQAEGKFLCVPNGYDADLFEGFTPSRQGRDNLVIGYFGSLYASPPYDISGFLTALDRLPEPLLAKTEVQFIGRLAAEAKAVLRGRRAKLVEVGFLPRAEGVRRLAHCDYLLLAANDATQHAGKLFEYMATGLPIIALTPSGGEVARLLGETGAGVAVDGHDPEAIHRVLLDAHARLGGVSGRFPEPDRAAITSFERSRLVAQLVRMTGIGTARQ